MEERKARDWNPPCGGEEGWRLESTLWETGRVKIRIRPVTEGRV